MDSNKCLQFALKNIKSALSSKDPKMKEIYIETAKNWLQDATSQWITPKENTKNLTI